MTILRRLYRLFRTKHVPPMPQPTPEQRAKARAAMDELHLYGDVPNTYRERT
jgi:hypothetical protein